MIEASNPYEAPKSTDLLSLSAGQIEYDGKILKVPKNFTFPPVCLKTGTTTDLTPLLSRKMSWFPPLLALLILLNLLIFLIVAACVSKKGMIHYYLSKEVARKRRNVMIRNWGLFMLLLVFIGSGFAAKMYFFAIPAVVVLLVLAGFCISASCFLSAKRIDSTHIWLAGVPPVAAHALIEQQSQNALYSK
jgi:hypothetical protein